LSRRWRGKSSLAAQALRKCSFEAEIIKDAGYFPHSHRLTSPHQKLTANGEDFTEESFICQTLLNKILTVRTELKAQAGMASQFTMTTFHW